MRVYLVAGEASGDRLGAPLIRALREELGEGGLEIRGVGGELMEAEGLASLFPSDELAVMGLFEVLPRLRAILARMDQTVQDLLAWKPDVLLTIDSPGFGLRVARRAKAATPALTTVHYVAPSVWAWRPGRARKMATFIDHVLALLPFEPPYMTAEGMTCDFVGHPASRLPRPSPEAQAALRASIGAADRPLVCVMPGSRRGEVSRLAGPFGETLALLKARHPDLAVVLPAAAGVAELARELSAAWPLEAHVLDPRGMDPAEAEARKFAAMAASDAALAASGTVTLELAAMAVPQVIGYRLNPLTAAIARRLLKIDTANLVNLLLKERAVPEFIQHFLVPADVADALEALLAPGPAREAQIAAADRALALLGRDGEPPSTRAARSVVAAAARGPRRR
ncbi:lipid-A-disaccharide synthase [Albimonas sp. CAU 1670]|uniref:lipid-A-disaccharide synthase n=1 Tax=Albimonas sp. CAU 1670 TaxID=3032599 RepID=UPI0023D9CDAC|nr:lipid-A-disaccharide synthase [Albimonas sp. CAU 1670]MDF2231646.1 lipid-A-disaccharide synthase [Albimonas sp. CAU 1670]